jgi:hypothetical protein
MPAQEHRRVVNQPGQTKTQAEWEQLRRALMMIVAQFKESDSASVYTIDIRVVPRTSVHTSR